MQSVHRTIDSAAYPYFYGQHVCPFTSPIVGSCVNTFEPINVYVVLNLDNFIGGTENSGIFF